jgi:hypothetical protein
MRKIFFICLAVLSVCLISREVAARETSPNTPLSSREESAKKAIEKSGLPPDVTPANAAYRKTIVPREVAKVSNFLLPGDFLTEKQRAAKAEQGAN